MQTLSSPSPVTGGTGPSTTWTGGLIGSQVSCMNPWGAGTSAGGNISGAQATHGFIGNIRA